jgi:hypothetical protein
LIEAMFRDSISQGSTSVRRVGPGKRKRPVG